MILPPRQRRDMTKALNRMPDGTSIQIKVTR